MKGLPLAYDRDLQEDKPPVFATRRDDAAALEALTVLVSGLEVDRDRMAKAASDPLLLATDAAEALVRDGVPFRDAHEQVAASVREGTFKKPRKGAKRAAHLGPAGSARRSRKHAIASSTICRARLASPSTCRSLARARQASLYASKASWTRRWKSAISFSLSPIRRPCGTAPSRVRAAPATSSRFRLNAPGEDIACNDGFDRGDFARRRADDDEGAREEERADAAYRAHSRQSK